jgi:hypothetical protein
MPHLSSNLFPASLLVVHDASGGGQHNHAKLHTHQKHRQQHKRPTARTIPIYMYSNTQINTFLPYYDAFVQQQESF